MQSATDQRKALTKADSEALASMPAEDWFEASQLMINRPWFRCQRLEAAGYLESRAVLEGLHVRSFYRRVDPTSRQSN
jgi:hypothetical protein